MTHDGVEHFLLSMWTYGRAQVELRTAQADPPFDTEATRGALLERLNLAPGISPPRDALDRQPAFSLDAIAREDVCKRVIESLEVAVDLIRTP